ncbi:Similar to DNApol-alpha50: DNA primase small subunit (Drosophila melanogaster) [Cotesia congregata]|uniref:DNA primase n=1 Tax=Cotesia congregata TaxID=51543 RepID=A0A8J2HM53_COTCN|nr:Similar to DNApol-alpha50: DNA primase small subunit (Drosophila melanogaster) [Cotesia congregata]
MDNITDLLKVYYSRLFPLDEYYKWLSYGDADLFKLREFSFTLEGDIYIRYQAFNDQNDLGKGLVSMFPVKIDIGAVFNIFPGEKSGSKKLEAMERELVFDIDLTDYDEVRTCCSEANICNKCWKYIGAIAEYFQLIFGGAYSKRKVNLYKIHPSVRRALNIISPIFVPMCVEEQNMLGTEKNINKFLILLPDDDTRKEVKSLFERYTTIMIEYCYPRLDINVTKGLNHLLKSPFCVHPKTGKISVPFNPKAVDKFDPITVPTIHKVIEEINAYDNLDKTVEGDSSQAKRIKDYKKTSLNKPLHVFNEFLRKLELARTKENIAAVEFMDF